MSRYSTNSVANGVLVLVAIAGALTPVYAESVPKRGALDARVRTAVFQPGQVYRITAFVGYHVHVQFESGESFVGLGAGDIDGLSFVSQGAHLFLKPKAPRVATNLTVITDRRSYLFEYSAEARRPDPRIDEVMYSLAFEYAPVGASKDPVAVALQAAAPVRNADYGYCGPRALKPVAAYDDGLQLHVRFAATADWPAVFARNADGSESLVNFTVAQDMLIVHRLAERYILRRGKSVGCLINRAFGASGTRAASGTVVPTVERRELGSAP